MIFPVTQLSYPVKIQFLSFTCEDITVVIATSVSGNRKRAKKDLAIGVYIINRYEFYLLVFNSTSHSFARVEYSNEIKFVSTRGHVISSIFVLYKGIWIP